MEWALAGLVAAVVAALVGGGFGLAMWRRRWLIADTPRSDAAHVFVGLNEVVGRAVPLDRPIVAPYSAIECVWYRSVLEKEERNEDGRSRWSQVSDDSSAVPFWVEDDTGRVLVRPKGASVYATERRRADHSGPPSRYTGLTLLARLDGGASLPSTLDLARYRSTEWLIRPGESTYVLGEATLRSDTVALEFAPCDPVSGVQRRSLLVATGDERRVARRTAWQGLALFALMVVGVVGAVAAWHGVRTSVDGGPAPGDPGTIDAAGGWIVVALVVVLALLPVLYVVRLHNRLVATRNRVEAAWSLIDVHLRRRHDLLPQLVDVVSAAAANERSVLETTTALRTAAAVPDAGRLPDDEALARASVVDEDDRRRSATLLALAERYPALATDANFAQLAAEVVRAEDAVAFARTFYNDAVNVMRDRRQGFPGILFAPLVPVPTTATWEGDRPAARPAVSAPPPPDEGRETAVEHP